jgi:hypothetical protein
MTTPDEVIALIKKAKGPGEVLQAILQDPYLAIGLVGLLILFYLFFRMLVWPEINPFKIQWMSNLWDWATSPRPPTPDEKYPYAKVLYPTYR